MSEEELGADDKPYEPTQKKLDEARKKGEVASSVDLTASAAYGGLLLAAIGLGPDAMIALVQFLGSLLERAPELSDAAFSGVGSDLAGSLAIESARSSWIWFAIPMACALTAIIAQQAFVVATEKLSPKLSRISPLSNAKQKYGRNGLFEFGKSFVKLILYSSVLAVFIWIYLEDIVVSARISPVDITIEMFRMSVSFLVVVFVISLSIGAIDFFWQRAEHLRKHRMSHKELMNETKESEGDPWLKGERRQRAYDIATNKMLDEVPSADVVIVNPTHYAVALKWDRMAGGAPICVAKGINEVAARIREKAAEAGVPVRRDPPTARALYSSIEIGEEVRPEYYRPVAAAIRFAETIRKRASARGRPQ